VKSNGNLVGRQSSFSPAPSQSNSLRSVRAISGRTSGFAQRLVSQSKGSVIRVRCEATATEKEAPVEKYEYQAEVSRLLDLIVHSLYSHKEVFLRELVRYFMCASLGSHAFKTLFEGMLSMSNTRLLL
jgi:hypothetical protein